MKNLLQKEGPKLSSELIKILVKNEGITKETARKRLSRLTLPITKIKGYFSDNQAFYHLQGQYKTDIFYENLTKSFQSSGRKYFAVINIIKFHYGFIEKKELASYTFNPIENLKGHKNYKNIIDDLSKLDVLIEHNEYYKLHPSIFDMENFNHSKAIHIAKNFILIQFNDWARKIGLVSYDAGQFHAQFGKFSWAFVSPSYIASLTSIKAKKVIPAFVVCDILIGNRIDKDSINFFIQKIEILKQLKNIPTFLPFLIVDNIELDSLKILKEKGIIIGFIDKLFGDEYIDLLKSLISTVTNAGAILKTNPEAYLELISKLNKLVDGKTNNLRGDLFELAVGYYHSKFCQNIDIGKLIFHEGLYREIDVYAIYEDKIVIAECKGYKSKITKKELELWITQKVTVIRKWLIESGYLGSKNLVFEFWSSGGFTDDAKEFIKNDKTKKYILHFIDENDLIVKSKEIQSKKFNDILKQYFLKEV